MTIDINDETEQVQLFYRGRNPIYSSIDSFALTVTGSELMDALALFYETKKEMEEDNGN